LEGLALTGPLFCHCRMTDREVMEMNDTKWSIDRLEI